MQCKNILFTNLIAEIWVNISSETITYDVNLTLAHIIQNWAQQTRQLCI